MSPPLDSGNANADDRAERIFYDALEKSPGEREAYLTGACGTDTSLRAEVDGLLEDHGKAGEFMGLRPPASVELEPIGAGLESEKIGSRIGPYKLLEQIGEGGFGTVWVAEQERPIRRRVALKIIKLGMDTKDVVARFEMERQALAMMDHPNIARVLDAGATPTGRPFFVMELVRGIKITDYCDQAQLPTDERLQLFIQVCNAVQHAHQKGVIHRDLKPSNILVTLHDGVPVPKVIDFGVAKATQQQRFTDLTVYTQFQQMIGTPLYMAPEQAEMSGLDVDTRSDIYSLGVLLYELLTGRTPLDPEKIKQAGYDEMRRVIREDEPQKPSTVLTTMAFEKRTAVAKHRGAEGSKLISRIRGDLDWIVIKALEKDRSRRYETANGLAKDIERHLASEPVQARPPGAGYRFSRLMKRNKVAFIAGAGIAAALIAGSVVSIWQAVRARDEADRAHHESERASAALAELRGSAPAFAEQARSLAGKERFDEAIEKLDTAIKLRPDVADYVLAKADLLESQFRFAEAAVAYRDALHLDPADRRAKGNAELCDKLASELVAQSHISRASLLELFGTMTNEQRPAAQMLRTGKLLGEENKLILRNWLERLKDLPIPPDKPIDQRLTVNKQGELELDLSNSEIADLRPLEGMPLGLLNLARCDKVTDVSPLRGMPIESLILDVTEVADLEPLSSMKSLKELSLRRTKVGDLTALRGLLLHSLDLSSSLVTDLAPLQGMPLNTLKLAMTPVSDITPLKGMPLTVLDLASTRVMELSPLAGMPLEKLDCENVPAQDFSPLAGTRLEWLSLESTSVRDLSILSGMPLKTLNIDFCIDARRFAVLKELRNVEELSLPLLSGLPESDFAELNGLRNRPSLRSITVDTQPVSSPEAFWSSFEKSTRYRKTRTVIVALSLEGKYSSAAQMTRDLIQGDPEMTQISFHEWISLGTLLLAGGDIQGYQAVCRDMTERFRNRGYGDEPAVRLCVLSTNSGISIPELRRLMPHVALINPRSIYRCWFVLTNGLLAYRAGRMAEAIELLREVQTDRFPTALIAAASGLSMACFQEGDVESAEAHLLHARRLIGPHWPKGNIEVTDKWADWLIANLLLQEAEKLIGSPAKLPAEK